MNTQLRIPRAGGFTLIELLVTIGLALFLTAGLVTIVQNVRQANVNQQALALLQDEQRFALTVMTDAIQSGGYLSSTTNYTQGSLPAGAAKAPIATPFAAGWAFTGYHTVGAADTAAADSIATQFYANGQAGPVLCNGTDTAAGPVNPSGTLYQVQFGVDTATNQLWCTVNNGTPIYLVTGVKAMAIYYGVKRDSTTSDYNVDTYVTWDHINTASTTEVPSISAVRVVLSFVNPLATAPGQPALITTERVIQVMGRAGPHT